MIENMWLRAFASDIVLPQQTHTHMKKREDGKEYFWWDWSWQELAIEGSKSGVWTLPQVEYTHNLYPNFRFTMAIVFAIIEVSIKYCDS